MSCTEKKFSGVPQVVESALSHLKKGVKGVYDKEAHYEERIEMMQWWADEIDKITNKTRILFKPMTS